MENIEKLDKENVLEKKEWREPLIKIILFKDTRGGGINDPGEDSYTNPQGS